MNDQDTDVALQAARALRDGNQAMRDLPGMVEQLVTRIRGFEKQIDALEALRPVWAQGHTNDSVAAQANGIALAGLWKMLGVDNQTAACQRLRELLSSPGQATGTKEK